jgi:hypothetical protein
VIKREQPNKEATMKKTLLTAIAAFGLSAISYAATLPADIPIDPPATTIDIGGVWSFNIDSYCVTGVPATRNSSDWHGITAGTLAFVDTYSTPAKPIDMSTNGITADPAATGASSYLVNPHHAGTAYTETRVFFQNNQCRARVYCTFSGTIFNLNSSLPASPAGESIIHVTGGLMDLMLPDNSTPPVNHRVQTAHPVNMTNINGAVFTSIDTSTSMGVTPPVPVTASQMVFYDSGPGTANYVGDQFILYFALDYLPLSVPAQSYTMDTAWILHAQSF